MEKNGILPASAISEMISKGQISAESDIDEGQIQPASLDLRLGDTAYRIRASFLPGAGGGVLDKIKKPYLSQNKLATRCSARDRLRLYHSPSWNALLCLVI